MGNSKRNKDKVIPHPQNQQQPQKYFAAKFSSGPLPSPEILERYDKIMPGLADRIVKQAENQSEHRMILEKKVIQSDVLNSRLGLIFAFIIGMTGIISGIYFVSAGLSAAGYIFTGGSFVSLVSVFIYGTRSRRKEREIKHSKIIQ